MEYIDYMSALVAIIRWNGVDIDELAEAIAAARDLGDVEGPLDADTVEGDIAGAVLRMQGRQPASTIWAWSEDEDVVAQDASGSVLTWTDLGPVFGYAA